MQPSGCWVVTVSGYEPTMDRAVQYERHGIGSGIAATALLLGWAIWRWRWRCLAGTASSAATALREPP
jgi:hypothetical protein